MTATTSTSVTNFIYAEEIDAALRMGRVVPFLAPLVAKELDLRGKKTNSVAYPIFDAPSAASTWAEDGNAITADELTPSQATISCTAYARRKQITTKASRQAVVDPRAGAILEVMTSLRLRIDTSVCALASSLTNEVSGGGAAVPLTWEFFNDAIADFKTNAKWAQTVVALLHPAGMKQLRADMNTSAAAMLGSVFGAQALAAFGDVAHLASQGVHGVYGNILICESELMPVGDTTGKTSCLIAVGNDACFGLAIEQEPILRQEFNATTLCDDVVGEMNIGAGILSQELGVALVHKA